MLSQYWIHTAILACESYLGDHARIHLHPIRMLVPKLSANVLSRWYDVQILELISNLNLGANILESLVRFQTKKFAKLV